MALKSRQGTGKTVAISNRIHADVSSGWAYVVNLTHREALGRVLAGAFGTDYRLDNDKIMAMFGQSLCLDSLIDDTRIFNGKNVNELLEDLSKNNIKLILILDEVHQVLNHLLNGGTEIKSRRDEVILNLSKLLEYIIKFNGELIVADAYLCDRDLKILADLSVMDYANFREISTVIHNTTNTELWNVTTFEDLYNDEGRVTSKGIDLWRAKVSGDLSEKFKTNDSRPILVSTTAQKIQYLNGTITIADHRESEIKRLPFCVEGQGTKVLRIDSEAWEKIGNPAAVFRQLITDFKAANELNKKERLADLHRFLKDYAAVVVSPSIETGISIQDTIKFRAVFCYFG